MIKNDRIIINENWAIRRGHYDWQVLRRSYKEDGEEGKPNKSFHPSFAAAVRYIASNNCEGVSTMDEMITVYSDLVSDLNKVSQEFYDTNLKGKTGR
jgi:hypothetical protein